MKMTELFLSELDREAERSKRALELVPAGKSDWKPHDRSMAFGPLANMVATMPSWIALVINQNELDLAPPEGQSHRPPPLNTSDEYLAALTKAVDDGRKALQGTTDEYLTTHWKLLVGGNQVANDPRHIVIRDLFNHLAHHRGQMTVYLRLMGAKVPALYGPSADDTRF